MSVILYHKDGKQLKVEPDVFRAYLSSGDWFLTVEDASKELAIEETELAQAEEDRKEKEWAGYAEKARVVEEDRIKEPEDLTQEEVPTDLTDDEVRQKAKSLGIKHWHNKNIDKLKAEVDEWQPEN